MKQFSKASALQQKWPLESEIWSSGMSKKSREILRINRKTSMDFIDSKSFHMFYYLGNILCHQGQDIKILPGLSDREVYYFS